MEKSKGYKVYFKIIMTIFLAKKMFAKIRYLLGLKVAEIYYQILQKIPNLWLKLKVDTQVRVFVTMPGSFP